MKSIAILLFLVAPFCLLDAQVSKRGLVAHYDFNLDLDRDRSILYDKSGNDNHGQINGNVDYEEDRFLVGCGALNFDGNSYVTVPNSSTLSSPQNEITIAVWFKINDGADLFNQWITICCKSNLATETTYSPQYRMQATAQTVSLNTEFTEKVIPQLEYDTWYFYAYTFDGSKVKVYFNGRFIFDYPYYGELRKNNLPLEIGRDMPGKLEYFYGMLDDLRIYNRALSQQELSQIFKDMAEKNDEDRCIKNRIVEYVVQLPIKKSIVEWNRETILMPAIEPMLVKEPILVKKPIPVKEPIVVVDTIPESHNDTPIIYQNEAVKVKSKYISIYPFDSGVEDGDTVSINVNGTWLIEKYRILNKTYNPSDRPTLNIELNLDGPNYLFSKAWNEGLIKPNTLTIEISDGVATQIITINSKVGESGGIRIELEG